MSYHVNLSSTYTNQVSRLNDHETLNMLKTSTAAACNSSVS